ncbi:hypothetical protein E2C01_003736 [Portunus trituberculatus]|uniref:Uncharacterized protein n=1 Tax=Portunus trituberculatus TaxID=210409 RepID=A0A5B7CNR9_PORTR|nr:hypothetical protein [Portunus trituberculatus]
MLCGEGDLSGGCREGVANMGVRGDGRTSLLMGQRLPRHQDVAGDVRRLKSVIVPDGGAEGAELLLRGGRAAAGFPSRMKLKWLRFVFPKGETPLSGPRLYGYSCLKWPPESPFSLVHDCQHRRARPPALQEAYPTVDISYRPCLTVRTSTAANGNLGCVAGEGGGRVPPNKLMAAFGGTRSIHRQVFVSWPGGAAAKQQVEPDTHIHSYSLKDVQLAIFPFTAVVGIKRLS